MKTKHYFSFIPVILLLFFMSCHSPSESDGTVTVEKKNGSRLLVCKFAEVKDTIKMKLSDLVEDFKIVRFENADTAFFKTNMITITDHYIGIRQSQNVFKLFDHDGTFLCDVGGIGQGPGEYSNLYDEYIHEDMNKIYLAPFARDTKVLEYEMNGKFIRSIDVGGELKKPKIYFDGEGNLSILHMPFKGEDTVLVRQFDTGGNKIKEYKAADYLCVSRVDENGKFTGFLNEIFSYRNTPSFDFMYTAIDTLCHYDAKSNRLQPVFTMDFGQTNSKPFHIYNELPKHYLTMVWKSGVIITDKEKLTSSYLGIVNDFFGNMEAPVFNFNKGWFYNMMEPAVLMEKIDEHLAKSNCSEEDQKKLEEVRSTLDENDNNVMFIAKLKQ